MKLFGGRGGKQVRRVATKLIRELPAIIGLLGRLLVDRRVPGGSKLLVAGVVLYVLSPLDLVPDFLGLLGLTDDIFLVALALRRLVASAGEDAVRDSWRGSEEGLDLLYDSMDELGEAVPGPVRKTLSAYAERW